ncbi:MAG: class I SAM-dependent methyltransferase [Chlorobiaceae bacterium]
MKAVDFDRFADEYQSIHAQNIGISGESPDYFAEYKVKDLGTEFHAIRSRDIECPKILDFGAGIGTSLPYFRKYLLNPCVTCLDVSKKSLDIGKVRFPGEADFIHFIGSRLPFSNSCFDIAFAACVFHHIDHCEHTLFFKEFHRVLTPDGLALIFEHNPYNPLTVKAVNTCPFDEYACLIKASTLRRRLIEAGFSRVEIRYRIFFPHFLRILRPAERMMMWIPFGAQYYALAFK